MFCCTPPHLQLSLAKPQLDFNSADLYPHPFPEILRATPHRHILPRHSSLRIDKKLGHEFRTGQDKAAQLQLEYCEASRELRMIGNETTLDGEHLWRVLSEKEGHELRVGDRIKIGFTELLVYSHSQPQATSKGAVEMQSQQHCRYCLSSIYSSQDPLLHLCKCNGSVKYLHLSCLRGWMMMKMEKEERGHIVVFTYYIGKLQCEICRNRWPSVVEIARRMQGLLSFEGEEGEGDNSPFVVLETDTLDENELEVKVFIKVNLDNKFFLGDNENSSDLAIDTIGVSPMHCFIHSQNSRIFITDLGSTTGTLVTLHEQQTFTNKRSLFLQYRHLLLQLSVQQPFLSCLSAQQEYRFLFKHRAK